MEVVRSLGMMGGEKGDDEEVMMMMVMGGDDGEHGLHADWTVGAITGNPHPPIPPMYMNRGAPFTHTEGEDIRRRTVLAGSSLLRLPGRSAVPVSVDCPLLPPGNPLLHHCPPHGSLITHTRMPGRSSHYIGQLESEEDTQEDTPSS